MVKFMAGFWSGLWSKVTYPFREDGMGADIADSSLFPFHRAQELMAKPPKSLTKEENEELKDLMRQTDKANEGITGIAATATERTVRGAVNSGEEILKAATRPLMEKVSAPLNWFKDNWLMLLAGLVGLGGLFSGTGFFGTIIALCAALFIGNEIYAKSNDGKGLFSSVSDMFTGKHNDVAVNTPAIKRDISGSKTSKVAVADTSTIIEKPSTGLDTDSSWLKKAGYSKERANGVNDHA